MKKLFAFPVNLVIIASALLLASCQLLFQKTSYKIETSDIPRFWIAFDSLRNARTTADSASIIQRLYLDKMSTSGQKFIEIRKYTASEYVRTIRKYPKFLRDLRIATTILQNHTGEIDTAFKKLKAVIPGYNTPDVCFAIGCFRGGGTTKKDVILIGSEIALADSTMNLSEFSGNLKSYLIHADGKVAPLIAHESIHCQQKHGQNRTLLSVALQEGAADFLPALILHTNINKATQAYALSHECELWQEFKTQINSTNLDRWLFNSSEIKDRPADLGYFMGMRICEAYYNKQTDKKKAIANLLDRSKYMQVLEESGYSGNCIK